MLLQFYLIITAVPAIWCANNRSQFVRRWSCIAGVLGEPYWTYYMWQNEQWGMFVVTIMYTLAWLYGIKIYWFTKEVTDEQNTQENLDDYNI